MSEDRDELDVEDDPHRHVGFPSVTGDPIVDQHERMREYHARLNVIADPWKVDERRAIVLAEMPYDEYLLTPEWAAKRRWMIREGSQSCARCGAYKVKFHVHHRTYERRGNELPEDLELLCEQCHREEHGIAA